MTRNGYRALREQAFRDAISYACIGGLFTLFATVGMETRPTSGLVGPLLSGAAICSLTAAIWNMVRFVRYDYKGRRVR
jgi:hypothetical protein